MYYLKYFIINKRMEIHSGYYKAEELTKINKYITQKENLNFFKEEMKNNGFTEVSLDDKNKIQWLIPRYKNDTEIFPIDMIYHQKKLKIWNKKSVKKCEYIHQYNFWSYIRKELLICNNECNLEDLTSYEITHMIHNFLFCLL